MSKAFQSFLKVSLIQSFDFRRKDKAKNVSFFVPLLLIFIFGSLLSGTYSAIFSMVLISVEATDQLNLVLYAIAGMATMLALTTGITKVKGILFGGKDYDMLASMPISKKSIIFVKLVSLYLVEAFYTMIFVLPATIVVCILGKSFIWLIDGLLLLVLVPILPLFLAGVLGILISFISDRFKFGNLISVLFYMIFLAGIFYVSFTLNTSQGTAEDVQSLISLLNVFGWFNPSMKLLSMDYVILPHLFFVISNLVLLFGMVWIFAACYDYFHSLMTATKSHQAYVEKISVQKGQFKALFQLDLKRYFTSKMYLMNTITGGILCVVLTIIMIASFTSIKDPEALDVLNMVSKYFVLLILWCVGMQVPSSVAINFEGKHLWQIKSLPIDYKKYSLSKILLSYVVLAPCVLIASGVLTIYLEKTFLNIFLTFVLPQAYLFSMCCFAYWINMHLYKLNWSNETEAVKNSSGALLSMLADFCYTGILCLMLIVPGVLGYFVVGAILSLVFVGGMAIASYVLVLKTCSMNLYRIEC